MPHVVLLAPQLHGGGVADHTQRLATAWRRAGCQAVVEPSLPTRPARVVEAWRAEGAQALLIQYVPFLYGRYGLSPRLERLARSARAVGIRVAVFVHEPWVPPTRLPWRILSPLQRRQLLRLARTADVVATPVPAWVDLLGGGEVVYVGSTLGDPPEDLSHEPRLSSPVVFSPHAAGLGWGWIAAASRAIGMMPALTVLGEPGPSGGPEPAGLACHWHGRLPALDVLRLLARCPLVLAPFTDGLTGRRTSALAALSVGTPVVSSRGHLYDPIFEVSPVAVAASKEEFVTLAKQAWDQSADAEARRQNREWFRRHFSAATLDSRLLELVVGSRA